MSHSNLMKAIRQENGIAQHCPITHLNSSTIFETHHGMIGSVIKVAGIPFDTETDDNLNQFHRSWHHALKSIDDKFCVYVTTHRHQQNISLTGEFNNQFLHELDQQYHQQFNDKTLYVNDIYITLLYRGLNLKKGTKTVNWLQGISEKLIKNARQQFRQEQIVDHEKLLMQLLVMLSPFQPYLLGSHEKNEQPYSELLKFFSLLLNAEQQYPLIQPNFPTPLNHEITNTSAMFEKYPHGNISQYLSRYRYFFGKYIQLHNGEHDRFAAMLSIKRYSSESHVLMFDPLYFLDCEFISTHSFAIEASDSSQKIIKQHLIKLQNVNDPAKSQMSELTDARDMLASDRLITGYHHHTLMLLADNPQALQQSINNALRSYAESGVVAIKEDIGQEAAFWAQIPGNINYIARHALITSQNFADFCSLHNYRTGYRDCNHLGSAVTLLETPSKTPYFFNFHAKSTSSEKQNPTKGHTTIIGGNGSGKTVMMAFLDAQASRYGGNTFIFDRDRGMEIYIRACGGRYAILSPNHRDIAFNPLQLADTPENRKFCQEWLCQLVKNEHETELPSEITSAMTSCVDYAFQHLAPQHRQLSNIVSMLPMNFSRWTSLRRWLRQHDRYSDGEYAYLFDNPIDNFQLSTKTGFDMTHFLDNESSSVRMAVFMYIMHLLKLKMNGQLLSIYLDEGWQYAADPYWVERLKKDFPTLRKYNAHLVFATQSPASVVQSALRNVILDNCATNIFFANPQAKKEHYIDGFNLTESEFSAIQGNEPASRLFLLKQEHESTLCRLNLSHMSDTLAVLSGNKKTVNLLEKIRQEVGDDPAIWLPIFQKWRLEV
jgi:type IV secretion system protein VirB4